MNTAAACSAVSESPFMLFRGHDTKVGPGRRANAICPGPRRPKGHDRLMDTMPPRADTTPPPCPTCGSPATRASVRTENGVCRGHYLCDNAHGWMTTWLEVA